MLQPRSGDSGGVESAERQGAGLRVLCALRPRPGLLERTYEACRIYELRKQELHVAVPVVYDGVKLVDVGYRIDILVERQLVLELKAIDSIAAVHRAQLLSYLRHSNRRLGLLINFNVERLKDGIVRQINGYQENSAQRTRRSRTEKSLLPLLFVGPPRTLC